MPLGDFGLVEIPAMGALRSHHTECDQIRTGHAVSLAIGLAFEARLQLGQMFVVMFFRLSPALLGEPFDGEHGWCA